MENFKFLKNFYYHHFSLDLDGAIMELGNIFMAEFKLLIDYANLKMDKGYQN